VISVVRPCSDAPGRTLERRFHLVRSTPRSRLGDIFLWCLVDHLSLVEPIRTSLCRCAASPMVVTSSVAVGTPIAGRPPHRSVRAELPHTAPT
jgi:hypothetical protein